MRNTPSGSFALTKLHYLQDLQTHIKRKQIEQQLGDKLVETNDTDTKVDCAKWSRYIERFANFQKLMATIPNVCLIFSVDIFESKVFSQRIPIKR